MVLRALEDDPVLPDRDDARDDAHLEPAALERVALLDMRLEEAPVAARIERLARPAGEPRALERDPERRLVVAVGEPVDLLVGQKAAERAAADEGAVVPLLVGDAHDVDGKIPGAGPRPAPAPPRARRSRPAPRRASPRGSGFPRASRPAGEGHSPDGGPARCRCRRSRPRARSRAGAPPAIPALPCPPASRLGDAPRSCSGRTRPGCEGRRAGVRRRSWAWAVSSAGRWVRMPARMRRIDRGVKARRCRPVQRSRRSASIAAKL